MPVWSKMARDMVILLRHFTSSLHVVAKDAGSARTPRRIAALAKCLSKVQILWCAAIALAKR